MFMHIYMIRHICMCMLMHMHKKQACTDMNHFLFMMFKIKKRMLSTLAVMTFKTTSVAVENLLDSGVDSFL